jgi:hypothetical protein
MNYSLLYGGMAGAIAIGVIVAGLAFGTPSHLQSQWFGYLVMLVALSLIFVGTKRYRDVECGGVIGFGRAVVIGLGISVVASVIYVIGWEAYLAISGRDFIAEYAAGQIAAMHREGVGAAVIEARSAQMRELLENYANPLFRLPVTFVEIFPVGLLVTLVSAAVLRNPRVLAARQSR